MKKFKNRSNLFAGLSHIILVEKINFMRHDWEYCEPSQVAEVEQDL